MKKHAQRIASATLGALLAMFGLATAGCLGTAQHVLVETDPPGATLYVDGMKQGVSPRKVTMVFKDNGRSYLQVLRKGREPSGNWYTPDTIPDDKRIVIRLTRN